MSHIPGSDAWLGQVREEDIDPQRPIIDPHIHLWRKRFGRDYLLAELARDTGSGHNVQGVLFVECHAFYDIQAPNNCAHWGKPRSLPNSPTRACKATPTPRSKALSPKSTYAWAATPQRCATSSNDTVTWP